MLGTDTFCLLWADTTRMGPYVRIASSALPPSFKGVLTAPSPFAFRWPLPHRHPYAFFLEIRHSGRLVGGSENSFLNWPMLRCHRRPRREWLKTTPIASGVHDFATVGVSDIVELLLWLVNYLSSFGAGDWNCCSYEC